jgi:hypothetical protein
MRTGYRDITTARVIKGEDDVSQIDWGKFSSIPGNG